MPRGSRKQSVPRHVDEIDTNRVVSYNLRLAREMQDLTQEQFATRLEDITGHRPTQASISALERAWEGGRRREFDAQELVEFAVALRVPIVWFFLPPPDDRREIKNTGRVLLGLVELLVGRAEHHPRIEERLREVGLSDYTEQEEISRMLTGQPDRITPQAIRELRERMLTQLLNEMATELEEYADKAGAFWDRVRQTSLRHVIAALADNDQLLEPGLDLPDVISDPARPTNAGGGDAGEDRGEPHSSSGADIEDAAVVAATAQQA